MDLPEEVLALLVLQAHAQRFGYKKDCMPVSSSSANAAADVKKEVPTERIAGGRQLSVIVDATAIREPALAATRGEGNRRRGAFGLHSPSFGCVVPLDIPPARPVPLRLGSPIAREPRIARLKCMVSASATVSPKSSLFCGIFLVISEIDSAVLSVSCRGAFVYRVRAASDGSL